MPYLIAFGAALPARIVTNHELAPLLGLTPEQIVAQSGIETRRYAAASDTVAALGAAAARDCLTRAGLTPSQLGMILCASGSSDQFCPGPASLIAAELGLDSTPALDLPMASAGSLAGLVLAARLAPSTGNILVIASEIMSRRVDRTPDGRNTAILFGDGAGAALIADPGKSPAKSPGAPSIATPHRDGWDIPSQHPGAPSIATPHRDGWDIPSQHPGAPSIATPHRDGWDEPSQQHPPSSPAPIAEIRDTCLHTDGHMASALAFIESVEGKRLQMDGAVIIRHALRRIPEAMHELLTRQQIPASAVGAFLLHQANANFFGRIAKSMNAPEDRFFANIARYGNTSSASMLIAAAEWREANPAPITAPIVFAAFGAGLNWGALLAVPL
jgi:3-oxoacyl-[acyl-carrier-protein] synthase III